MYRTTLTLDNHYECILSARCTLRLQKKNAVESLESVITLRPYPSLEKSTKLSSFAAFAPCEFARY